DEPAAGLHCAAKAMRMVPDFDAVLFLYLDQMISDPATVLAEFGNDRRSARAYTEHLIATNRLEEARFAWKWLRQRNMADDKLTASYVDALLRSHRYFEAQQDWADYLGKNRGDYPGPNILSN